MRTAIVGLGPMGRRHVEAIQRVKGLQLVAACDRRQETLAGASLNPSVARFRDFGTLLSESRTELLVVSTTAPSHAQLVLAALDAGVRRILCEKPLACSLEEATAMVESAQAKGATLAVNHSRRHARAYRWLAETIASGEWGEVRSVRFFCRGIGLGCLGTHFVDLIAFLSGQEWRSVWAWIDPERGVNPRGEEYHDPGGLIVGQGKAGARFLHHQIEDVMGPTSGVIDLTKARVSIDEGAQRVEVVRYDRREARASTARSGQGEARPLDLDIISLSAAVLAELVGAGPITCSGELGLRALEVVVAAHVSHENEHRGVDLPLKDTKAVARRLTIT